MLFLNCLGILSSVLSYSNDVDNTRAYFQLIPRNTEYNGNTSIKFEI